MLAKIYKESSCKGVDDVVGIITGGFVYACIEILGHGPVHFFITKGTPGISPPRHEVQCRCDQTCFVPEIREIDLPEVFVKNLKNLCDKKFGK
jgi:hypothetical protein